MGFGLLWFWFGGCLFVFFFSFIFFYIEKMKINVLFSNFQFTMDGLGKADSLGKKSARFGAQLCRGARAHPGAHSHGLWGADSDNQVPITRPSPSGLGDAGSTGASSLPGGAALQLSSTDLLDKQQVRKQEPAPGNQLM